jgi:cytochrome c oxidase assembly protein subunit 15
MTILDCDDVLPARQNGDFDMTEGSLIRHDRLVRIWLLAVAALIFAIVLVGGATRLTESGLSITEWKPVTGVLPPLSDSQWQSEFEKYQAIPQYQELNRGMSLDDFKGIFWWEWGHRMLGRVIGVVFFLPLLFFAWRGWIRGALKWRLAGIFALGAVQGGVGWWMVASGLSNRISVSQYRLAFHLTLACIIFTATLWTALRMTRRPPPAEPLPGRIAAFGLLLLVLLQIYLGALVAGLDAGKVYNTWPLIDESIIPSSERLFFLSPLWHNFFENLLTVQFQHRMVAYTLWLLALLHLIWAVYARAKPAIAGATVLFIAVTLQATLGIVTLLHQAPISLSLAHQGMAMIVLSVACFHAARMMRYQRVMIADAQVQASA